MIPARINYHGNRSKCGYMRATAFKQLGILHEQMIPGKLQTYKRTLEYDDGSRIICRAYPGELNIIDVYVPYKSEEEKIVLQCPILTFDYENSTLEIPNGQKKKWYLLGGYPPYYWKTDDASVSINYTYHPVGTWVTTQVPYATIGTGIGAITCPTVDIKDSCPLGEQTLEIEFYSECSIVYWYTSSSYAIGYYQGYLADDCQTCNVSTCKFTGYLNCCYITRGCKRWRMDAWDGYGSRDDGDAYWGVVDGVASPAGCAGLRTTGNMRNAPCGSAENCADYCHGNHLYPECSGSADYEFCSVGHIAYQYLWCGD